MTTVVSPSATAPISRSLGLLATALVAALLLAFAFSVDFPRAAHGFKGDESTYYSLAYSIASDGDFAFTRRDLIRVWNEFPAGPEGIFLKRGGALDLRHASGFPWIAFARHDDPSRLYYGKSFIYPLFAAPFVALFGTSGFLVFHALLLTACFGCAVAWLISRGSSPPAAVAYATAFFLASVVPVYFIWLTPELFNFAIVFLAYFAWSYKERDGSVAAGVWSDYAAAALLGIATFSKPLHVMLIGPLVLLALWRRQWRRAAIITAVFGVVVAGLFSANYAISGDVNYQGGNRKTFYGYTGFPFANPSETFETAGDSRATDAVPLNILATNDTFTVFRHNLEYFVIGRYNGFVPYFFPGVVSLALFFSALRRRPLWQWLIAGMAIFAAIALLLYMPYTYSGGGGPIGNRYYLSFYGLFLFVTPLLRRPAPAVLAMVVGALFTAPVVLNPFEMSYDPGAHAASGLVRALPIELTQLNDLPVAAKLDRARQRLGGEPPVMAYFVDDNAHGVEEDRGFWIKGHSRADILLRAPAIDDAGVIGVPLRLQSLTIEVSNGPKPNHVTIRTPADRASLDVTPGEVRTVQMRMGGGVPYRPATYPTNYVYAISIASAGGFVPFLEAPPSSDSRLLGARIRLLPTYDRGGSPH